MVSLVIVPFLVTDVQFGQIPKRNITQAYVLYSLSHPNALLELGKRTKLQADGINS
jgi:hypothetical protein